MFKTTSKNRRLWRSLPPQKEKITFKLNLLKKREINFLQAKNSEKQYLNFLHATKSQKHDFFSNYTVKTDQKQS